MKKNDSGFTLIELIICMVIFAIVAAAVFGFMISGSRTYSSVTERLNLQLDSQLVMDQIGNYVIDCNACLFYNGNTLYIINEDSSPDVNGNPTYTSHVFDYKANGHIYYKTGSATLSSGTFTCVFPSTATEDLLAENVTNFSVTPISSDGVTNSSAVVHIVLKKGTVSFSGKKTIALRNKPAISIVQTN